MVIVKFKCFSAVLKKIANLKTKTYKSRSSAQRKIKNTEYAAKKKESCSSSQAINEFRMSTALSNYCLCIKCKAFFNESSAREIKVDEEIMIDLVDKTELRRMQKFFVCNSCDKNENSGNDLGTFNLVAMSHKSLDHKKIFFPNFDDHGQLLDDNQNNVRNDAAIGQDKVSVFLPSSLEAVKLAGDKKFKSHNNYIQELNKCCEITANDLSQIYSGQFLKYFRAQNYPNQFHGSVCNREERVLSEVSPAPDDAAIHGSETWSKNQVADMEKRFDQLGSEWK